MELSFIKRMEAAGQLPTRDMVSISRTDCRMIAAELMAARERYGPAGYKVLEKYARYKDALERILNYKSSLGDSYDDLLMIMAIAQDAIAPCVMVTGDEA